MSTDNNPTMTADQVGADLDQGVRELAGYVEALRWDDLDPGYAMASITWTSLKIAERAQMYARAIVAEEEKSEFLSLDGALFDDLGKLVATDLDVFKYLVEAFAKSFNEAGGM